MSTYTDVANDQIGHSFQVDDDSDRRLTVDRYHLQEMQSASSLVGFAKGVIRAASILGPETVTGLLTQWARGDSLKFKFCVVLAGVYVDKRIELSQGLRIERLPISSDLLPISMPDLRRDSIARVLGQVLMEVDASTSPALFVPTDSNEANVALSTRTELPRFGGQSMVRHAEC